MVRLQLAVIGSCLVLALGCAFDSSGTANSLADDSGTGSDTSADSNDGSQETSDSGSTSVGDGDGDPSTTGDGDGDPSTTGDGDGDPSTGDGDPTGDGDGDGDPTGDGDGDSTGDGDGDPTTGDGDGDGDGDPDAKYYGDCPNDDDDECLPGEYCLDPTLANWRVCTTGCSDKADCPAGPPGSNPVCVPISGNVLNKGCFLNCNGDDACPVDMHCQSMNLNLDKVCVFK
jgi:hypothetical protein